MGELLSSVGKHRVRQGKQKQQKLVLQARKVKGILALTYPTWLVSCPKGLIYEYRHGTTQL